MHKAAVVIMLTLLFGACDNEAERLAQHEKICLKALEHGMLEIADKECSSALGLPESDALNPATRAARLLRLGSIKRQRQLYTEADTLINQALAIEQSLPEQDPLAVIHCQRELSLSLAGQKKWQQGAVFVETLLSSLQQLSAKEQKAITNMARIYVINLKKNKHDELAVKIETSMNKIIQTPAPQPSPGA